LATFRTSSAAKAALRLLSAFDPKASHPDGSTVAATVAFAVAAAAVVAVGLESLVSLSTRPSRFA
jgi:hypothetical protein